MTPGGERARPRLDSLTGLRWWAAFGVFVYHMLNFAPVPVLKNFAPYGNYGVAFFFILSGFVLTYSARSTTTVRNFYWRRFARIYPAHFVALLLAVPVFYSFDPESAPSWVKPMSFGVLLLSVVLIQGWSRDPAVFFSGNPAAWTLTVEAFFYALHPWVNRVLRPFRTRGTIVLLISVFAISVGYRVLCVLLPEGWWAVLPVPITRLSEFIIGMGIAQLMLLGARWRVSPALGYGALAAFVLWQVAAARLEWDDPVSRWGRTLTEQILIGLFALIILACALRDAAGRPSVLRSTVMVKLGAWSFAFYLVHATVMYAFKAVFGLQPLAYANLIWYPPVFGIALLVAWALYRFVEHPLELRMRRWGDRRFSHRSAARLPVG